MGWIRDGAYDHEGWVANVLADGRVTSSVTGAGVIVHELTADDISNGREIRRYPGSDHIDVVVPWDEVAAWRVVCQCGWTGDQRPAYADARNGTRDCPEELEESVFAPAWDTHVAPFVSLVELDQLADQLRQIELRIREAVARACASGATWGQIARAVGISEQTALLRWGTSTPEQSRS